MSSVIGRTSSGLGNSVTGMGMLPSGRCLCPTRYVGGRRIRSVVGGTWIGLCPAIPLGFVKLKPEVLAKPATNMIHRKTFNNFAKHIENVDRAINI